MTIEKGLELLPKEFIKEDFHRWRGRTVQAFAAGESIICSALILIHDESRPGTKIGLRRSLGHRLEDLEAAVRPGGPFAVEGEKLAAALLAFQHLKDLRDLLCHGEALVKLDCQRNWVAELTMHEFDGNKLVRKPETLLQSRAVDRLSKIEEAVAALRCGLQSLQSRLGKRRAVGSAEK